MLSRKKRCLRNKNMRLSTKIRYGIIGIFDIAYHNDGKTTHVKDISKRQGISGRYLEQIFYRLKKKGILNSERGPRGGYYLAKKPEDITLFDVIEAIEGPIEIVFCLSEKEKKKICKKIDICVIFPILKELSNKINDFFKDITIKDICREGEKIGIEKDMDKRLMYFI